MEGIEGKIGGLVKEAGKGKRLGDKRAEQFYRHTEGWINVKEHASFSAAIDAIGASDKTLIIPDEQAVSDDKTVPANVTLKFMQGGSLNISAAKTVTINGHIEAGLYQIFEGAGTVVFGVGSVKEVYPQWWGAIGDNTADDTISLQAAATALPDYGTLVASGHCKITSPITFSNKLFVNIKLEGRISPVGCSGIHFDDVRWSKIWLGAIVRTVLNWTQDEYAIKLTAFQDNYLNFTHLSTYQKGIFLNGDGDGIAYNRFSLGRIFKCKYGLYFTSTNGGWVNDNNYFGGNICLDVATKAAESGSWGFYFTNPVSNAFYTNRFYGPSFEHLHNMIRADNVRYLLLDMPYHEDIDDNLLEHVNGNLLQVYWRWGYGNYDATKIKTIGTTDEIFITGGHSGTSRPTITRIGNDLEGSDTWDPGSIANGAKEPKNVTVTGAALGDFATASFSLDVQDLVLNAQVTGTNTVTCILANNTGGAIDLGEGTVYVKVIRK